MTDESDSGLHQGSAEDTPETRTPFQLDGEEVLDSDSSGEAETLGEQGGIHIDALPVPIRELPRPPQSVDKDDNGTKGSRAKDSIKLIYHIPSRICKFLFGYKDTQGIVKDGLLSRRYPHRREEIVLDVEECEFIDDAFAKPILKLVKLVGLESDELFMIVIGVTILMPRALIPIEEEYKKSKGTAEELRGLHPPL